MTQRTDELSGAAIEEQLAAALDAAGRIEGFRNVFLVACGGSHALMLPIQEILQSQTGAVEAHAMSSREFITRAPKSAGPHSMVIACSHSGNTPETVAAITAAREAGATTIALTNLPDSPLSEESEHHIYYQHGDEKLFAYTAAPLLYRLVYGIIDQLNGTDRADDVSQAVESIDRIVAALHVEHYSRADAWAKKHKHDGLIYTLGSGPNYGNAYSFAICFLQEMLWVHSQGINSAEFFHGPFEVTDVDVPFIELIGLGASREIDERAHDFVTKHSDEVLTVDASEWDLAGVAEDLRASYAHLVFGPLLRLYADRLSDHKGHPLSVRRYMWRSEY